MLTIPQSILYTPLLNLPMSSYSRSVLPAPTDTFKATFAKKVTPPHYRLDKTKWIDKDVYNILFRLPKAELHVHQGGSSDVSYLKYRLFKEIKEGQRTQLAYLSDKKGGKYEYKIEKKLKNLSDDKILEILNLLTVRRILRFDASAQYKLMYLDESTIAKLSDDSGKQLLGKMAQLVKKNINLLDEYRGISKIINPITKNTPSAYFLASLFAKDCMEEHARYVEYRVSPFGRTDMTPPSYDKSSAQDVIHAVQAGFEDANLRVEKSGRRLEYGLIILMERNPESVNQSIGKRILKAASPTYAKWLQGKERLNQAIQVKKETMTTGELQWIATRNKNKAVKQAVRAATEAVRLRKLGYKIVGVDLAGGEKDAPVSWYEPAFQVIHNYNARVPEPDRLGITIHTGETPMSGDLTGPESMLEAIRVGYENGHGKTKFRIGHGIQLIKSSPLLKKAFNAYLAGKKNWQTEYSVKDLKESSPLLEKIIDNNIHLEMCPKSNIQTRGIDNHDEHPALFLLRLGVNVGLSSDNRTISNSDVTNELVKQYTHHQLTYKEAKIITRNSFESAFIFDKEIRDKLLAKIEDEFWDIEHSSKYYNGVFKLKTGHEQNPTIGSKMTWLAENTAEMLIKESQKNHYDFTTLKNQFNKFADKQYKKN